MLKILVVDDDAALRKSVIGTLSTIDNIQISEAVDGLDAMQKVRAGSFNLVILDVDMPRLSGMEALPLIKDHDPSTIVIILTAYATIDDAVLAVKDGAYNYLSKPVKSEELLDLVAKGLKAHSLVSDIAFSAPILMESDRKIIGNTLQMKRVFNIINRVSKVDTPVLIRGASGTGKELVARAIHFNSPRKDENFVAVNCSAVPDNLFESEFFGHEKGAFTGADARKIGKFQHAEAGTLFLDEVGDLPLMMQVKLLRVLQEKVFTPVGSNREVPTNVRIITATNRPLEAMIKDNKFRDDLFYRLNVIPIILPQLNQRTNDLPTMIKSFVKKFNEAHQRNVSSVSSEVLSCLQKYEWPGNIRELENVIEHAFIWETSNILTLKSIPEHVLESVGISVPETHSMDTSNTETEENLNVNDATSEIASSNHSAAKSTVIPSDQPLDFNKQKEEFEKEFIIKALQTFKGRINQTALHANIPKKTLLRKIEKYEINAKDYAL